MNGASPEAELIKEWNGGILGNRITLNVGVAIAYPGKQINQKISFGPRTEMSASPECKPRHISVKTQKHSFIILTAGPLNGFVIFFADKMVFHLAAYVGRSHSSARKQVFHAEAGAQSVKCFSPVKLQGRAEKPAQRSIHTPAGIDEIIGTYGNGRPERIDESGNVGFYRILRHAYFTARLGFSRKRE